MHRASPWLEDESKLLPRLLPPLPTLSCMTSERPSRVQSRGDLESQLRPNHGGGSARGGTGGGADVERTERGESGAAKTTQDTTADVSHGQVDCSSQPEASRLSAPGRCVGA